jgi:toxin ParE1/3/4
MPRIQYTLPSREDLVEILRYLRQHSHQGARRVQLAIHNTFQLLAENPGIGENRDDFSKGIRSFPVEQYRHYLVFYRPLRDGIIVMRVLHGARDLPRHF